MVDITEHAPLEVIPCPNCGQAFSVTGELGPYHIVEVVGSGGMGVVYKAYDAVLDRYVALKLLPKSYSANAKLIKELEIEAELTASINDPNVVKVYCTGWDRGRFYLAMELVEAGSLHEWIRREGRMAEIQVLQLGIQIASGLKATWNHGMIHRDVKPANILIAGRHVAKIVDFGLAIFMDKAASVRGEIWGSPYYVAPEKLEGEAEDFRSDIYSLGATLFHALTGRPPFEAENPTLVAIKHLKTQPVSLQAFAPWVSNPTAYIVNRMLSKNRTQRFQSYDDLIQSMQYVLDAKHHKGSKPQSPTRVVLETESDRKTWTWVVLGMVAVFVAVTIFIAFAYSNRGPAHDAAAISESVPRSINADSKLGPTKLLEPAMNALAERKADAAVKFQEVIASGTLSPTDQAWATFLGGLAELDRGEIVEARSTFARVANATSRIGDESLRNFLTETSAELIKPDPIAGPAVAKINRNSYKAVALFAYGLHHIASGRPSEGTNLLRQFRSIQPPAAHSWLSQLHPTVTLVIQENAEFEMLNSQLRNAKNSFDRVDAAFTLRKFRGVLAAKALAAIAPYAEEIDQTIAAASQPPTRGLYQIRNQHSGKIISVDAFGRGDGVRISQYPAHLLQSNCVWEVIPTDGGAYSFRILYAETVIDANEPNRREGGAVSMWSHHGAINQQWKLDLHGEGYFKIRAKVNDMLLTIKEASMVDGAGIEQRSDTSNPSQLWRFERIGEPLPGGWFALTVGTQAPVNKVIENNGTFTVTNQGEDIWGARDSFTMIGRGCAGDFDLVVRVVEIQGPHPWTKAGLIVRNSFAAEQTAVFVVSTPEHAVSHQSRPSLGKNTTSQVVPGIGVPVWLKLERRRDSITSFYSTDGSNWTKVASENAPSLGLEPVLGIALCSHDVDRKATAIFDNLKLTQQ